MKSEKYSKYPNLNFLKPINSEKTIKVAKDNMDFFYVLKNEKPHKNGYLFSE